MSYKYISIPTSRLSEEWLINNNIDPEEEYLCNSETEFLEKVKEAKLINML